MAFEIRLDWEEYYRNFEAEHGGHPVLHRGKLLFSDGWQYEASSHAGPEYPPPDNAEERAALIRRYWWVNIARLKREVHTLEEQLITLEELVRTKSGQLYQLIEVHDGSSWRNETIPLNIDNIREQLSVLQEELKRAEQQAQMATAQL